MMGCKNANNPYKCPLVNTKSGKIDVGDITPIIAKYIEGRFKLYPPDRLWITEMAYEILDKKK